MRSAPFSYPLFPSQESIWTTFENYMKYPLRELCLPDPPSKVFSFCGLGVLNAFVIFGGLFNFFFPYFFHLSSFIARVESSESHASFCSVVILLEKALS